MVQIFCTVGTTKFDILVSTISSPEFLLFLQEGSKDFKVDKIVIQHGKSIPNQTKSKNLMRNPNPNPNQYNPNPNPNQYNPNPNWITLTLTLSTATTQSLKVEFYDYKKSLKQDMQEADLVVCSGGSGTILECLEMGRKVLVVPNPTLQGTIRVE